VHALVIGRFQPLHLGHIHALKYVMRQCSYMIIGIGSSQYSWTWRNPFSASERMEMLVRALRAEGVELGRVALVPIPDSTPDQPDWARIVLERCPKFDVVYSNDDWTRRELEAVGIVVKPIPFYRREVYSATRIRALMASGDNSWVKLVPKAVMEFMMEINGASRVREIWLREQRDAKGKLRLR